MDPVVTTIIVAEIISLLTQYDQTKKDKETRKRITNLTNAYLNGKIDQNTYMRQLQADINANNELMNQIRYNIDSMVRNTTYKGLTNEVERLRDQATSDIRTLREQEQEAELKEKMYEYEKSQIEMDVAKRPSVLEQSIKDVGIPRITPRW